MKMHFIVAEFDTVTVLLDNPWRGGRRPDERVLKLLLVTSKGL
jgi:hypothetical protein